MPSWHHLQEILPLNEKFASRFSWWKNQKKEPREEASSTKLHPAIDSPSSGCKVHSQKSVDIQKKICQLKLGKYVFQKNTDTYKDRNVETQRVWLDQPGQKLRNFSQFGSRLKPRLSTNFDAISLDTSNLTSILTSSQTKWVYLQSISISHSIS